MQVKKACPERSQRVFVAMSGGVDSSVAAALLKEQGYDVCGIFMQTWSPPGVSCTSGDDRRIAARAAAHLDIPFAIWDFRKEYKREVVDYMTAEYAAGRTPNPDAMCNSRIKFGIFLKTALEAGADFIATGHYVRLRRKQPATGNQLLAESWQLEAARDSAKDQSYFLWALTQNQLKRCLFPIGDYEKSEVRAMARKRGLPNWNKKDSQGLCFVGKFNFADFLRACLPAREGVVLTATGAKIGAHDGAQFVTIGQRHGLDLSSKGHVVRSTQKKEIKAHYVVEKNIATNTIVVAENDDPALYRKKIEVININWISGPLAGGAPRLPLQCLARIRYRQPLQAVCIIQKAAIENKNSLLHNTCYMLHFREPQRAVAPGQSAVFYTEDGIMLGGGIIC